MKKGRKEKREEGEKGGRKGSRKKIDETTCLTILLSAPLLASSDKEGGGR